MAEYLIKDSTLTGIADAIRDKTGENFEIFPETMPQAIGDVYEAGLAVGEAEIQQIDQRMDGLLLAEDELINGDAGINLFNEALFINDSGEYGVLYWHDGTVGYEGPPGQSTTLTLRDYAPGLIIGKTYTFSYEGSRGNVEIRGAGSGNPKTFVLTEDIYNGVLYFPPWDTNSIGDYVCYVSQIMLNVGSKASPYVPYVATFSLRRGATTVLSKIDTAEENLPLIRAAGKEEGHQEGYDEGHTEGFNEGQSYGYDEGYNTGYSEGYDYGSLDGHRQGLAEGYENGYWDGYQDGVEATRPIGTLDITKNGVHDVEGYQYANVDVPIPGGYLKPEGTLNITENGEYDVKQYAKVKVETPVADAMDEFWDLMQNYGNRTLYAATFSGFPPDMFYPKYDIKLVGDGTWMFAFWGSFLAGVASAEVDMVERLNACGVKIDFSEATSVNYTFSRNYSILKLPDLNLSSSIYNNYFCYYLLNAVEIGKVTGNVTASWTNAFRYTNALQHITFEPETVGKSISFPHSSQLTMASIESIIYGLSSTVSGQTLTLSKTAVDKAFGTSGNANGSTTRDWAMLKSERSNWTVSLV